MLKRTADALADELARIFADYVATEERATGRRDRRGLPKHLLIIGLRFTTLTDMAPGPALAVASRAYGRLAPSRRTSLKKCLSQARALLTFGLVPDDPRVQALRSVADHCEAFAVLDDVVGAASLSQALAHRAATLAGRRGGRPPNPDGSPERYLSADGRASPGRVLQAVVVLIMRAKDGDARASAELAQIQAVLSLSRQPV